MTDYSKQIFYYGQDTDLPPQTALRAGPLSLLYEYGSVRQIRLGSQLIVQQIYFALRDQNWGTIEPTFFDHKIIHDEDTFRITFQARHLQHDIDFSWQGTITGAADGTIVLHIDGEALSDFLRNRIGFCVLHPARCAGLPCTIEQVDGQIIEGTFPLYISPHQPFHDIRAITFEAIPDLKVEVRMEGDTFEMEDQRNWTDASFKTYCTPLGLPFPVRVKKGDKVTQTITVRLVGTLPDVSADARESPHNLRLVFGDEETPLPAIGLACASHGRPLSTGEIHRLRALNLAHLRFNLDLRQKDYAERLRQAVAEARQIGVGLEIALTLTADARFELEALAKQLALIGPPVLRWLIFHQNEKSTSTQWVALAREVLAEYPPGAAFGGGTDAFFTELNRGRPDTKVMDFVTFSTNPQVHAFDNTSLVETLPIHHDLIVSARQFVGQCPIIVSPVTFKMRWNPNATGTEPPLEPGELPRQVDPRQMSLFGAGWTLGNTKYLAEAGAHSITYYESCGWLGVMETEAGSPLPQKFHSYAGGVFPMYHLFADIGAFARGTVIHSISSDPMRVVALALRRNRAQRILIANLTPAEQTAQLTGNGIHGVFTAQRLDETNVEMAMRQPEAFRSQPGERLHATMDTLTVSLLPYALLRLDRIE